MFALRCGLLGALVTLGSYAGQPVELAAAASAPSLAQIHGVYAWMSPDATRANLLMTIAATDASATTFADDVQYVFHVSTYESFAQPPVATTNVICQFANAGDLECWVGASYVRGNPSSTTGLVSENLLIRIFAGRRSDPMAFNRDGFEEAMRRLREAGYRLGNMDITLVCERPKVSPHKDAILANLARMLGCDRDRLNLKGKTHERVDAVGDERAVEVHVVALVHRGAEPE